ncbi:MAG: TonB-dependent receptor [Prevotellaceae bacterium]|jgi:outer membrane cobalamin receptor|nr:TonB-dependent receptor [Prevotellaceae bacterium]
MKKIFLVAISLMCIAGVMQAQEQKSSFQMKGRVTVDGTNESIPYATITVENDSARVITRLASDNTGRFSVNLPRAGQYRLLFSAVGFSAAPLPVELKADEKTKDLGNVSMKEGVALKEVIVVAQKPLIKSDPDKLVYSVEADPDAQSNTVLEIMRKVPLLSVDGEDNVTLNGQRNYKVLVNGKSSSLMSNNFKDVIRSMPANSIKDIEVITNPSSKYEAEGVGGIINIITLRNRNNGYTGSVGANADTYGGFGGNGYIAANIDKFSFSTNIFNNQFRQPEAERNSYRENFLNSEFHYSDKNGKDKIKGNGNSLNFEAGYEIDSLNLISASAWGYLGGVNFDSESATSERDISQNPSRSYRNTTNSSQGFWSISGNVDYQRGFRKKDKMLTTSYQIEYNPQTAKSENNVEGTLNYTSFRQKSDNDASGQSHTFQLDYFDPLTEKHQIETGVKGIYRRNASETDISVFDATADRWQNDNSRRNDLDYNQYILGVYAGYLHKFDKLSAKGGLRVEHTWNDGLFKSQVNTPFHNTLFNLIPYVSLTYALKPAQTLKASYTQRLFRPGIRVLNPYVNDSDPLNINYGNPNLDAEVAHSFSLSYGQFTPKFNINLDLNSSITSNAVEMYSRIADNGVRHETYGNIGSNQRYGLNVYASYRVGSKFSVNINGRLNYAILDSNNELNYHNEGLIYGGNIGARLTLWKGGAVSANAGGTSPPVMLQGRGNYWFDTSIGLTQKLFNNKMDISLYANDPFARKIYFDTLFEDETYTMRSESFRWGQRLRLSLVYRFGKMNTQVKKARRGITNDDQRNEGGGQ